MKLSQYKEKKNNKKLAFVIVAIIFLIGGIILDKTFASFKENKSFKVMEGNFIYEGSGDIIFAFYHGKESLTKMPGKENDDNLIFDKGECDKGASIQWSDELWAPTVMNLQESKTTCKLYFKKIYDPICNSAGDNSGACYLAKKGENDKINLIYDNTKDNNIRFVGATPDNYVKFNNETWRIIGVMDNIEDESGSIGSHIKIIRDSIGDYSFDSSGTNEWSKADIEVVLNDNFYNKKAGGTCYGYSGAKTCPKWEIIGLNDEARSMVSKVKWNTGTAPTASITTPQYMYEMEKTTNWPDYVGLIYTSDYGYATSGQNEEKRLECLTTNMRLWGSSPYNENCAQNSWLYGDYTKFTMTPYPRSSNVVFCVFAIGYISNDIGVVNELSIRPVVYLNSNVKIEEDTSENYGSKDNPYRLSV